MMNKKFMKFGLLMAVMMLLCGGFCGCVGLANKSLQESKNGEKLIGVFITEDRDLKNYKMQEGDTLYFSEKKLVRADGSVKKLSDKEINGFDEGFVVEGKKNADSTYRFDDIQGYYFGGEVEYKEEKGESYQDMRFYGSEGVFDWHSSVNIKTDEEDNASENEIEFSAKVVLPSSKELKLRMGAVYMRADGSVYTNIPGGTAFVIPKGDQGGYGSRISQSNESGISGAGIKEKNTKETIAFSIETESADFLQGAKIMQMGNDNRIIKSGEAEFSHKEQFLKLEEDTAYVIIEENLMNAEGKSYVKRTSYDCEGESYDDNEGHQIINTHIFRYTDKNGRMKLINCNFEE